MTEKATKKRKSIKQPERGPPKMRLSLYKVRQITAAAIVRKESEELARKTREEQNAALEVQRKKARDVEKARKSLVVISKTIREKAKAGESSANVLTLYRDDLDVVSGVSLYSPDALLGQARHVYDALMRAGYATQIGTTPDEGNYCITVRWL